MQCAMDCGYWGEKRGKIRHVRDMNKHRSFRMLYEFACQNHSSLCMFQVPRLQSVLVFIENLPSDCRWNFASHP